MEMYFHVVNPGRKVKAKRQHFFFHVKGNNICIKILTIETKKSLDEGKTEK